MLSGFLPANGRVQLVPLHVSFIITHSSEDDESLTGSYLKLKATQLALRVHSCWHCVTPVSVGEIMSPSSSSSRSFLSIHFPDALANLVGMAGGIDGGDGGRIGGSDGDGGGGGGDGGGGNSGGGGGEGGTSANLSWHLQFCIEIFVLNGREQVSNVPLAPGAHWSFNILHSTRDSFQACRQ